MDFKNKQGTVDAHNVNFDFKPPEIQDSHNVILNFTHKSDGSTNLNFGEDNSAEVRAKIKTAFRAKITAIFTSSDLNQAYLKAKIATAFRARIATQYQYVQLKARINTGFKAQISAEYHNAALLRARISTSFNTRIYATGVEPLFATLKARINTSIDVSKITVLFDINHLVGLLFLPDFYYQQAEQGALNQNLLFSKAAFKAALNSVSWQQGISIAMCVADGFEQSGRLHQAVKAAFEEATGLSSSWHVIWQEDERIVVANRIVYEEAEKLRIARETTWQEMIRKRRAVTFEHEVAHILEPEFVFSWDGGLSCRTNTAIPWDVAKPIYYRKSSVPPIVPQPKPQYVGSTDLNFVCLCHDVDSHNVVLNFGADDCIPSIPNKNWWHIVNQISVTRLDDGTEINVLSGNYRTDRQSWCWSYSLTIPVFELSKLEPNAGQPVILKIMVNGYEHLMLLENRTRSRQFGKETYNLSGRSVSALLDAPSSPPRAFLQENERTSVQLAQAEIDRSAYPDLALNWRLINDLGWIVPTESFSYSSLTPIKAIQEIANAGGGFVYSEADTQAISIKPLYRKAYWDSIAIDEYDILLPESVVIDQSTNYEKYPDYNGITLTNDKTGLTGQIKRTGTGGDVLHETVSNHLFTSQTVMGSFGKSKLAKAGLVESHTFSMPLTSEIGQCKPADILAFNAEFWGVVDAVSVSFTYAKVMQSVTVERVNHG